MTSSLLRGSTTKVDLARWTSLWACVWNLAASSRTWNVESTQAKERAPPLLERSPLYCTIYPFMGPVWQESARDHGSLKMYATRRRRAMLTDWRFIALVHIFVPTSYPGLAGSRRPPVAVPRRAGSEAQDDLVTVSAGGSPASGSVVVRPNIYRSRRRKGSE